jgi:hypothetical protein
MNWDTYAARRRSVLAERCRALAVRCRLVPLIAVAAMLGLVTGCGGASSGAGRGPGDPAGHASGQGSHGLPDPSGEPSAGGRQSATSGGALFGGNAALATEQGNLGRRLAIVRVYAQIGEPFPLPQEQELMASGSTLLISLATSGTGYASVAAGGYDSYIRAFLRAVDRAAVQYHLGAIYVTFEHEPDSPQHVQLGSPAQFVQAWDHVHQLAESAHLDWNQGGRLHWVWILTHSSFSDGKAGQYWPGPGEADVVGADGYNSYACKVARNGGVPSSAANKAMTPASIFGPAIAFAHAHGGLPVFISEWGSDLAPTGAQPTFIRQMQAFIAGNREIGAALYWDSSGGSCDFSINGSPISIAALAAMGHSAALQGRVIAPAN